METKQKNREEAVQKPAKPVKKRPAGKAAPEKREKPRGAKTAVKTSAPVKNSGKLSSDFGRTDSAIMRKRRMSLSSFKSR